MQDSSRPNILWICTDQQRWDTINALGNQYINTPNLDRLVDSGVSFLRAYTQSPVCTPSRATFLTGRYPATHHVLRNGIDHFPSGEVLVTKLLSDAGYRCGLVGKLHLSRAQNQVEKRPKDDGYQEFYYCHHPYPGGEESLEYRKWLKDEKNINIEELYSNLNAYGKGVQAADHQTEWCGEKAIEFINRNNNVPWLLSLNFFDPHPPFDPPEEFLRHYNSDALPLPVFREDELEHQKKFREIDQQTRKAINPLNIKNKEIKKNNGKGSGPAHASPPDLYNPGEVKACYYASIEFIDFQIGKILTELEKLNQLENTLIIFMSDHGDLLGDHGLIYKGCRFYEGLVHVPLIISYQGKFKRGLRSNALVELVDIAPTLLETVGLGIPYYMQGRSLYSILTGESDSDDHKSHVICEYNDSLYLPDATHGSMYFDGRYKSIVYHNHDLREMYDLLNDPAELNDLWDNSNDSDFKYEILIKHFNALMETVSPGIKRTARY